MSARRSTRRIRPCDRLSEAKGSFFHAAPTSGDSGNRSRLPTDVRFLDIQREICPVTGRFRVISKDYRVSPTVLGKGHCGVVRECEHRATSRVLAVKSIDKSKVRRMDHLRREVCLLRTMNHRGIMKFVDCYEDAAYVYIVTERYTGGELFRQVIKNTTPEGCFSECEAASTIKSLLEAVAYLHENDIVHRDIKPENILFESPRGGASIRLIDFGLSRKRKRGEAPMKNRVGTAFYMAPELLEGSYDRSCDIWSVGTIAYILLCGYPPFNGRTDHDIFECIKNARFDFFPATVWSSKSNNAMDFIKFLLRRDPRRRPTAREALGHAWLRTYVGTGDECDDVNKPGEPVTRIQSLGQPFPSSRNRYTW